MRTVTARTSLTLFFSKYPRPPHILSLHSHTPKNAAVSHPNSSTNFLSVTTNDAGSFSSSSTTNNPHFTTPQNDPVYPLKNSHVTVVLLGWLGAKERHVRKYAEWYRSRGFNAVCFVVGVKELFGFDLGRSVEERVRVFADEVSCWVLENDESSLLFHTFSNTGWLLYGNILDIWMGRKEMLDRIKGCVIDSGGGDPFNPRVWAAGFAAALLKKRSSSSYSRAEHKEINGSGNEVSMSEMQEKEPLIIEMALLSVLEKFFAFILNLPNVDVFSSRKNEEDEEDESIVS